MNFLVISGFTISAILTGLFVWILIIKFTETESPTDDLKFLHFMPQYTNGHWRGVVLNVIKGAKRDYIEFMPTDHNWHKIINKNENISMKSEGIWIEKNKLSYNPKGSLTPHEHILWGLPSAAEDLSEDFKKTAMGIAVMTMTENLNSKKEETDLLRLRMRAQSNILERSESLEIVEDALEKFSEINKDLSKLSGEKQQKTSFPFSQSQQ